MSAGDRLDKPALFSTCPQSTQHPPREYLDHVVEVARWSESAGCTGILVYTDNGLVDPWLVAHVILQNTDHLSPLVAVQPVYMHPYSAAKMVSTLGLMYGRRLYLNMVAGGFRNDLLALDDQIPHDRRYDRVVEYTTILTELLGRSSSDAPLTFTGDFYRVENLKLAPPTPDELLPGVFLSGSSEAGLAAVAALGATGIQYPRRVEDYSEPPPSGSFGIRVGVIAREESDDAWTVARERFPGDRTGQIKHELAMKVSDSRWHEQLSDLGDAEDSPYWLWPFQNYATFCPYLVGDFEEVGRELAEYMRLGYGTFIVDIPRDEDDLKLTVEALERATSFAASTGA